MLRSYPERFDRWRGEFAAPVSALPSDSCAATASALANASEAESQNELWDIEFDLDLSFPRAWSPANIRPGQGRDQ